jgi:hypothetical protein
VLCLLTFCVQWWPLCSFWNGAPLQAFVIVWDTVFMLLEPLIRIRDSSVNIATGYGLDGWGSFLGKGRIFSFLHSAPIGSGAHQSSYIMGTWWSFPRVKPLGHEADHSPSSSAEVRNGWAIHPLPIVFMARTLIKHRTLFLPQSSGYKFCRVLAGAQIAFGFTTSVQLDDEIVVWMII